MEVGGEAGGAKSPWASPGGTPPPTLILASGLWNLETVLGAGALSEGSDAAAPGD